MPRQWDSWESQYGASPSHFELVADFLQQLRYRSVDLIEDLYQLQMTPALKVVAAWFFLTTHNQSPSLGLADDATGTHRKATVQQVFRAEIRSIAEASLQPLGARS